MPNQGRPVTLHTPAHVALSVLLRREQVQKLREGELDDRFYIIVNGSVVRENLDECVLCELCLDASPPGTVRVKKLYDGTELGDWGFMPTEPSVLHDELHRRSLTLVGAFVPVALSDPDDLGRVITSGSELLETLGDWTAKFPRSPVPARSPGACDRRVPASTARRAPRPGRGAGGS